MILTYYYYNGMTFKDIGIILDLSEAKVSEIHESILRRLKKMRNERWPDRNEESSEWIGVQYAYLQEENIFRKEQ